MDNNCVEYRRFLKSITNNETKIAYVSSINKLNSWLDNYSIITSWNQFVTLPFEKLNHLLTDFVLSLIESLNPNSIRCVMAPVKKFLTINDANYNKDKLRLLYPPRVKPGNQEGYSLTDIQQMFDAAKTKRDKALLLFLASGGIRAGAPNELEFSNVKYYKNECKIVTIYADDKAEYVIFLTPEASIALDDYLEERRRGGEMIFQNSPLFKLSQKSHSKLDYDPDGFMAWHSVYAIIAKLLKNSGVVREKSTTKRYRIAMVHGMRKFFYSQLALAQVHPNNISKLVGHKTGLNEIYHDPKLLQLFSEYEKAIPYLTIDEKNRQQFTIKKQEKEIEELRLKQKLDVMNNKIDKLTYVISKLDVFLEKSDK